MPQLHDGPIEHTDAESFMRTVRDVQLIWTDPPYGTGQVQKNVRTGLSYRDLQADEAIDLLVDLGPVFRDALAPTGVLAVCLDRRIVHEVISALKTVLVHHGDIIFHYETGGTAKKWWSHKHDTVGLFSLTDEPLFRYDQVPTEERKAPVTRNGVTYDQPKKVSSVWTINKSTTDSQNVGYPSQKPLELVERCIDVHTRPGDLVVDPFSGSGTTVVAALGRGRLARGCDASSEAVAVANKRLRDEGLL